MDDMSAASDTVGSSETKETLEEGLGILHKAALATAALAQPVRLTARKDGDFVFQTSKGVNTPSNVTEEKAAEMRCFFEDLCSFVDEHVGVKDCEDGIMIDPVTDPEWFGPYRHDKAFYVLDDLTYQLDPNRSKTFLTSIFNGKCRNTVISASILDCLKKALDKKCERDLSCVYRLYYPHVQTAGPVAMSPVLMNFLSAGVQLFMVNNTSLEEFLNHCISVVLPKSDKENDIQYAPHLFGGDKQPVSPNICICCLLAEQTRSSISASQEVAYKENETGLIEATTFIGVRKILKEQEAFHTNEVDLFAPTINIHGEDNFYMADAPVAGFKDYQLIHRDDINGESLWVVEKASTGYTCSADTKDTRDTFEFLTSND